MKNGILFLLIILYKWLMISNATKEIGLPTAAKFINFFK